MSPNDKSLHPQVSVLSSPHQSSFFLHQVGISTEAHNWSQCTMRDFGAFNHKLNVFIKPTPSALGLCREGGRMIIRTNGQEEGQGNSVFQTQQEQDQRTYELRDCQYIDDLNRFQPDRVPALRDGRGHGLLPHVQEAICT